MTNTYPSVLTFAGTDSAGLAGIHTDIKTQHALGAHCSAVITAVTAQNNQRVISINPCSAEQVKDQIEAVSEFNYSVIKSGLIATQEQVEILASTIRKSGRRYVCDTVLGATSGTDFSSEILITTLKEQLIPVSTLVTPNIPEAEKLTGLQLSSNESIEQAAKILHGLGAQAVYIKGGHRQTTTQNTQGTREYIQDYYYTPERAFWLSSPKIETANTRGTGCAFASAAAAALALNYSIEDAVIIAKMAINQGLRHSYELASSSHENAAKQEPSQKQPIKQKGPINLQTFPKQQEDLPYLTQTANFDFDQTAFKTCVETSSLGLYPVLDSAEWLDRILAQGVTTAQLRVKHLSGQALENEIIEAIKIGKRYNCRLFINDYWELAIKHNAYGVHLGQEDLDTADINAIRQAGLRLGTSTHCHYEVARAHALKPSYIACGPVFKTTTKDMPWIPHDLNGLQYWQDTLHYPLVAIGGINRERIPKVAATGVSGIAMITAITLNENPESATKEFIALTQDSRE